MSMLALPDYNSASLCWRDTRIVYLHGELVLDERERELRQEGKTLEQIARILSKLRNDLRSWTRTLMSDRVKAAELETGDPNWTWDALLADVEADKFVGDDRYKEIIAKAKRSRASVNKMLGLHPTDPPSLPPVLPSSPTDAAPCPKGSACCLQKMKAA